MSNIGGIFTGLAVIPFLFLYLGIIGFSIYCMVLFVKLARRGIRALDIYINQNRNQF